jgi:hypothetical protein
MQMAAVVATSCPKHMVMGPCGGVRADGSCEVLPHPCVFPVPVMWLRVEIAFLHLKKTVRGLRRPLRGQSPELARQEAWALLLSCNITATAASRAAGPAGIDPGLIPFTAVLGLIGSHVAAEVPCRHCGHRPASPLARLILKGSGLYPH